MRLSTDKVNLTWGDLKELLQGWSSSDVLDRLEQRELINCCYKEKNNGENKEASPAS